MGGVSFNRRTALNATLNMDGRQKGTECSYILMVLSGVVASYVETSGPETSYNCPV